MKRFDQSMKEWMEEKHLSTRKAAELCGFQSKTTITRALEGKSSAAQREMIVQRLVEKGIMEEPAACRLRKLIREEETGPERMKLCEMCSDLLLSDDFVRETRPAGKGEEKIQELLLLGEPWPETAHELISFLKRRPECSVTHVVTQNDTLSRPALFLMLLEGMLFPNYNPVLLMDGKISPWHVALGQEKSGASFIQLEGERYPLSADGDDEPVYLRVLHRVMTLEQKEIYRSLKLENPTDFIGFLRDAQRLEKGRDALIIKPTPGIQMFPSQYGISAFEGYLAQNLDPIMAGKESIEYIHQMRSENFTASIRKRTLLLSGTALRRFAETGLLEDQFYAFRPFSREERKQMIAFLLEKAKQEQYTIRTLKSAGNIRFSIEVYPPQGVLIYPSETSYYTGKDIYREMFFPGKEACKLFGEILKYFLTEDLCNSREETLDFLEKLKEKIQ